MTAKTDDHKIVTAMKSDFRKTRREGCGSIAPRLAGNAGFTLIELMIAIAIFSMVIAGVVGAFYDQLKSHNTQQQILEMQQNARATMYFISRELRMAGYDPTGNAGASITADAGTRERITFSMDIIGEANDGVDNDGDGNIDDADPNEIGTSDGVIGPGEEVEYFIDKARGRIIRSIDPAVTTDDQTLAVNMDALDFVYYGDTSAGCAQPGRCYMLPAVAAGNPDDIRTVEVSILARTNVELAIGYNVSDTTPYYNRANPAQIIRSSPNDGLRRIQLTKEIKLRNMGLN